MKPPFDAAVEQALLFLAAALYSLPLGPCSLLGGFLTLVAYDLVVGTLGALTTTYVPPGTAGTHVVYGTGMRILGMNVGSFLTVLWSTSAAGDVLLYASAGFTLLVTIAMAVLMVDRLVALRKLVDSKPNARRMSTVRAFVRRQSTLDSLEERASRISRTSMPDPGPDSWGGGEEAPTHNDDDDTVTDGDDNDDSNDIKKKGTGWKNDFV